MFTIKYHFETAVSDYVFSGGKVTSKEPIMYRKFTGKRIFTGTHWAPQGSVLIIDENEKVIDILPDTESGDDIQKLPGILCPGFINAHVHVELSHMKGVIKKGTGLVNFLLEVVKGRRADDDQIKKAMIAADHEMWKNGIVAAGDICNTKDSMQVKSVSSIHWNNFVEVLNLKDDKSSEALSKYADIADAFRLIKNDITLSNTALSPHSPYSVSAQTFELINNITAGKTISMHNQECAAENDIYISGGGEFLKLYQFFGLNDSPLHTTGQSSIKSVLPYFNRSQRIILVHNTYTSEEDINFIMEYAVANELDIYFCLCPNANLYIENNLPDVSLMIKKKLNIILGTDSYSSNQQLSIAAEIATLLHNFPAIELSEILQWATLGGAKALRVDDVFGSFTIGKKPGVVMLDSDFNALKIV